MLARIGHHPVFFIVPAMLLVVAAAAGCIAFIVTQQHPAGAADTDIPFEHSLAAMGLVATPGPDQPSGPVTVDRVVVDGEHTYIAYHVKQPWHSEFANFTITAIPGGWLNTGSSTACAPAKSLLPDWIPWRQSATLNCLSQFESVAPSTRAVRLQISLQQIPLHFHSGAAAVTLSQGTVYVPLDLHALRQRQSVPLHGTASAGGVTVSLGHLYLWPVGGYLEGQVTGPFNSVPEVPHAYVNGREVRNIGGGDCSNDSCPETWILPHVPHGTHLALVIPQVLVQQTSVASRVRGPWQIAFTVP